ncbi:tail completion protein gp17 [Paracoccus hibiscisoli]|uniref:tail completion protein gp17 n=1 Tax=Paracoccus hibiscisoli TaxID=2023261 RepID=UPI0023F2AFB4|nr:DUF3168 domain-containing protein [Paracoccus hibiscisoli]
MEEALRALLIAGLQGMPSSRVNWGQHLAGVQPYLVLNLISLNEGLTMQGPDGLETARVQIDAYAPTYKGASDAGRAVKALLHGHHGDGFQLIEFSGMRHMRETGDDADDGIYRASLDFLTHWRQPNG